MLLSPTIPVQFFPVKTTSYHFVPNFISFSFPSTVLFHNDYQLSSKTCLTQMNLFFPFRKCSAYRCVAIIALKAQVISGGHQFVRFLYKLILVTRNSLSHQGMVPKDLWYHLCCAFVNVGIQFSGRDISPVSY